MFLVVFFRPKIKKIYEFLDAGYWMLGILDAGCWVLDPDFTNFITL